jgi:hypothetical protein
MARQAVTQSGPLTSGRALDGEACQGPFSFFRIFGLASYLSVEAANGYRASATRMKMYSYIIPLTRASGYIIRCTLVRKRRHEGTFLQIADDFRGVSVDLRTTLC